MQTVHTKKVPLLICPCIAEAKGLTITGSRSTLGTALPARNNEWLNAGPTAWICFNADNGDIKFPMKMQIIAQTHEQQIEIFNLKK